MKPLKKVEIVIGAKETKQVIEILESQNLVKYTIIKNASGRGEVWERDGYGLTDVFQNNYLLLACTEEEFNLVKEDVREIIADTGGICLVSDVLWLIH
ncbi:MAG: transcriptional regulator [Bacteroidota bacterium]